MVVQVNVIYIYFSRINNLVIYHQFNNLIIFYSWLYFDYFQGKDYLKDMWWQNKACHIFNDAHTRETS